MRGSKPVAAGRVEKIWVTHAGGIVGRNRCHEVVGIHADEFRQRDERVSGHRRQFRANGALIVGNFEQPAVEDRIGHRARRLEMDGAREPLPGFVHEATALVEETAAVFIDHDAVGIDQHHRRGIPGARIDRLGMHAVPITRTIGAEPLGHSNAVAGIKSRTGRYQPHRRGAFAKMRAHHVDIALKTTTSKHDGVRRQCLAHAVLLDHKTGDAIVLVGYLPRDAAIQKNHTGLLGSSRQLLDEDRAAAGRLNARWAFRQIIGRLNEFDAVRCEPLDRRRRFLRKPREIALVTLEIGGCEHVVHEARLDAVG